MIKSPSFPTFSIALAMRSPISLSPFAAVVPTFTKIKLENHQQEIKLPHMSSVHIILPTPNFSKTHKANLGNFFRSGERLCPVL